MELDRSVAPTYLYIRVGARPPSCEGSVSISRTTPLLEVVPALGEVPDPRQPPRTLATTDIQHLRHMALQLTMLMLIYMCLGHNFGQYIIWLHINVILLHVCRCTYRRPSRAGHFAHIPELCLDICLELIEASIDNVDLTGEGLCVLTQGLHLLLERGIQLVVLKHRREWTNQRVDQSESGPIRVDQSESGPIREWTNQRVDQSESGPIREWTNQRGSGVPTQPIREGLGFPLNQSEWVWGSLSTNQSGSGVPTQPIREGLGFPINQSKRVWGSHSTNQRRSGAMWLPLNQSEKVWGSHSTNQIGSGVPTQPIRGLGQCGSHSTNQRRSGVPTQPIR